MEISTDRGQQEKLHVNAIVHASGYRAISRDVAQAPGLGNVYEHAQRQRIKVKTDCRKEAVGLFLRNSHVHDKVNYKTFRA